MKEGGFGHKNGARQGRRILAQKCNVGSWHGGFLILVRHGGSLKGAGVKMKPPVALRFALPLVVAAAGITDATALALPGIVAGALERPEGSA